MNVKETHQFLMEQSEEICSMNECTEDQHNCESYAYFNHDEETGQFELADVCGSDYAQKCYDSFVCLPITEDQQQFIDELESNLIY